MTLINLSVKELASAITQNLLYSAIFYISAGLLIALILFLLFLRRELLLSHKLRKKIFLIGSDSSQAKTIKDLLGESIFKYIDETGDLNSIDKIKPEECLLIGLVYFGYEDGMDRILEVARNNKLPIIVYCGNGCRLEGDFETRLNQYRWFDKCQTPYRFVSIALAAVTANSHDSLFVSLKKLIWRE